MRLYEVAKVKSAEEREGERMVMLTAVMKETIKIDE